MELNKKLDLYLKESEEIKEAFDITADPALVNTDALSFTAGLKKIQILLSKANTPRKYAITFQIINDMVQKFPLKAKFILDAVVNAYKNRFGV